MGTPYVIKSISELHRLIGIPPPKHPAISFIRFSEIKFSDAIDFSSACTEMYMVILKTTSGNLKYGRNYYDFEEGTMLFVGPNQIMYPPGSTDNVKDLDGWCLFFHPDLLYQSILGSKMNAYSFFAYETDEALHLSENEKRKINDCLQNIVEEYSLNIDQHSNELILSNLELLLNYCKRFYSRQFLTRRKQSKDVVVQLESLLLAYFNTNKPTELGLPTVKHCANELNLSPNYLSDLLKKETGKNTKEHIDYYLIEKAKQLLLGTELNVSEIAYELGFEYPKSFGKLFKKKTGLTPKEYRGVN